MTANEQPTSKHAATAVIYVRVSTNRQVVAGASLQTQERDCRAMCNSNEWEVVRLFREEGESAKTTDRPQLQELLAYCRTKPRPDYVVVHHTDRWARNGQDHDTMRSYLLKLGVKLRSYSQRLGEDPHEQFFERIMSGANELDNKLRGMRSLAGMKTRLQGGRWTFKAPLGYVNGRDASGNKTLLADSARAPFITEAFNMYATGLHTKEHVRRHINQAGMRSANGRPTSIETFRRMLKNPRYAGILDVNGWDIKSRGNYEPLTSPETFNRVQEILAGRRVTVTPHKRNNPDFPLRAFVRCGLCHKPFTASWSKSKTGRKYAYYHCQNRRCTSPTTVRVNRQDLENAFVDFLRQQQPDSGYLRLFHKVVLDVWNQRQADTTATVRRVEKQLEDLKERKRKLNEAFVYQQAITPADYEQMRTALNDEIAAAELSVSQARVEEVEVEEVLDFAETLLLNTAGAWVACSLDQKQRLQRVLFPQGVEYADGAYRTQETSFLFKGLEGLEGVEEGYGSATGNRTRV